MEIKIDTSEKLDLLLEALKTEIINANSYGLPLPPTSGLLSRRQFL
jgi:hypothetical protein